MCEAVDYPFNFSQRGMSGTTSGPEQKRRRAPVGDVEMKAALALGRAEARYNDMFAESGLPEALCELAAQNYPLVDECELLSLYDMVCDDCDARTDGESAVCKGMVALKIKLKYMMNLAKVFNGMKVRGYDADPFHEFDMAFGE